MKAKDSDSSVQRNIEEDIAFFKKLIKSKILIEETTIEFDGISDDGNKIYEIYCGIETLKPGQFKKIAADILKMIFFEKLSGRKIEKHIIVVDKRIMDLLDSKKNRNWVSKVIEIYEIKLIYHELNNEQSEKLKNAKMRQSKNMKDFNHS